MESLEKLYLQQNEKISFPISHLTYEIKLSFKHFLLPHSLATVIGDKDDVVSWWLQQRLCINKGETKFFDSMLLQITWCLWIERKVRVFGRAAANVDVVVKSLLRESED